MKSIIAAAIGLAALTSGANAQPDTNINGQFAKFSAFSLECEQAGSSLRLTLDIYPADARVR